MQNKALTSWGNFLRVYFTEEMIFTCIEKETVMNKIYCKTSLTISKPWHLIIIVL